MRTAWCTLWLALACLAALVTAQRTDSLNPTIPRHAKSARAIRGFKNLALSTARGFGKRSDTWPSSEPQTQEQGLPLNWVADQMNNSPALARLILRRFVDSDHDDYLSPEELLRVEQ